MFSHKITIAAVIPICILGSSLWNQPAPQSQTGIKTALVSAKVAPIEPTPVISVLVFNSQQSPAAATDAK